MISTRSSRDSDTPRCDAHPRFAHRQHRRPASRVRRLTRYLIAGATLVCAMSVGMSVVTRTLAHAESHDFTVLGSGNLFVAYSDPIVGVCAVDHQGMVGDGASGVDFTRTTHPVGSAITRNRTTSQGSDDLTHVVDADKSYTVTALYHLFADNASSSTLESESFAWAVQQQLTGWGHFATDAPDDGGARGRQMIEQAQALAGPYTLSVAIEHTEDGLALTEPTLVGGAGQSITGIDLALHIDGPATFDDGTTDMSMMTGDAVPPLVVTGVGQVSVTARATGLPSDHLDVWESTDFQDLVSVTPQSSSVETRATIDVLPDPADFTITTRVKADTMSATGAAVDVLTVTADNWPSDGDGKPVTVIARAELYGPFPTQPAQSESIPAGAPLAGSTTIEIAGPGTWETPELQPEQGWEPGYYTWVISTREDDQKPVANGHRVLAREHTSAFAIPEESFKVLPPSSPPNDVPPGDAPPKRLANTGPEEWIPLAGALTLVGAGLRLLAGARRRHHHR